MANFFRKWYGGFFLKICMANFFSPYLWKQVWRTLNYFCSRPTLHDTLLCKCLLRTWCICQNTQFLMYLFDTWSASFIFYACLNLCVVFFRPVDNKMSELNRRFEDGHVFWGMCLLCPTPPTPFPLHPCLLAPPFLFVRYQPKSCHTYTLTHRRAQKHTHTHTHTHTNSSLSLSHTHTQTHTHTHTHSQRWRQYG